MHKLLLTLLSFVGLCAQASQLERISPQQLHENRQQDWLIVDVRSAKEYAASHVPGAINLPHDQIRQRISELLAHKDKPLVLYCRSGYRAGKAAKVLAGFAFSQLKHLDGDMQGWQAAGLPTEQ